MMITVAAQIYVHVLKVENGSSKKNSVETLSK